MPQKRFAPCRVHERFASDDATSRTAAKNSNQDPLPNVSQEAAAIDKSMGTNPPEIEQGTPIQEVRLSRSELLSHGSLGRRFLPETQMHKSGPPKC